MSEFEDQLFADLMREHGEVLARTSRPAATRSAAPRRVLVAAGAAGLAGAVGLGVAAIGTGSPAYAVTHGADGTITVSLRDISGVDGANAELRRLGVPVVAVPMSPDCTARVAPDNHGLGPGRINGSSTADGTGTVTFDAASIPSGDTLVLAAQASDRQVSVAAITVRGTAPACMPEPGPGQEIPGRETGRHEGDDGGPSTATDGARTAPPADPDPTTSPAR
jgi:hypothetical protein